MTYTRRKVYLLLGLLGGVFLYGYYRGSRSPAPAPRASFGDSQRIPRGNSAPSSATEPAVVPSVNEYTPPSLPPLPLTKPRKAPTSRPLPVPESKVDKVIRLVPEPASAATGGITGPVEITITTQGDVQAPTGQGARLEVIQFRPRAAALERRLGIGWRISAERPVVEPLAVLSLLNFKGRLRLALTTGWTGPGAAALVQVAGSAKIGGWNLSVGPEYATNWRLDRRHISAVLAVTF